MKDVFKEEHVVLLLMLAKVFPPIYQLIFQELGHDYQN